MNKTVNRWNAYIKQVIESYSAVYAEIIKQLDQLIARYDIPTDISAEDEEEEKDD